MSLPLLTITPDKLGFLQQGKPWVQRGVLAWPWWGRYINEGYDVARQVLRDYRAAGANTIACAGMLSWWPGLDPRNPAYWPAVRSAVDLAADEGMRLQWMVLCDTASLMPSLPSMLAHWERFIVTQGDKTNVTFIGGNQQGHPSQSRELDVRALVKPKDFPQLLCARDNPMESGNPAVPPLDFAAYCSSRDEVKGFVEVGSSMWYVVKGWPSGEWGGTGVVSINFEGPHDTEAGPWADPGKWRQLARSLSFQGTGGGNFYGDQASRAELLTGVQRMCAVEFLGNIPMP